MILSITLNNTIHVMTESFLPWTKTVFFKSFHTDYEVSTLKSSFTLIQLFANRSKSISSIHDFNPELLI